MSSQQPLFGAQLREALRKFRLSHPAEWQADQTGCFDRIAAEVLRQHIADTYPIDRNPRLTKKEMQGVLFDALAEATGKVTADMTASERRATGVALAQIRQASPDVTPFEIKRRARLYRQKWREWALTPNSLCGRWSELGDGQRTLTAKVDPYIEPPNWRSAAKKIFPDALDWGNPHDFDTIPWLEVSVLIRPKILAAIE